MDAAIICETSVDKHSDSNALLAAPPPGAFITVTLLFFFWGFITVMNDVLIPFLKESFTLSYFQAGLVQFAFFGAFFVVSLGYFVLSVCSGDPINRIGYKKTIVIALLICAAGCALFSPAAGAQSYGFFLGALFFLATGVTLLQIAANPYAAVLGRPENASARLNLAQGFNSLGTTLAPIAGGLLLYRVFAADGEVTLESIKAPYLIYGAMFVGLAIVVGFSHLPSIGDGHSAPGGGALAFPQLRLGMAAIFLYVGAEVAIGSYLVSFIADDQVMGWDEAIASTYLAFYWGGAMIGRLCGAIAMAAMPNPGRKPLLMAGAAAVLFAIIYLVTAVRFEDGQLQLAFLPFYTLWPFMLLIGVCLTCFVAARGRPPAILSVFSAMLLILLVLAGFARGPVALWAALGVGLFNSIMWSNIFTLAIDGLGKHTSQGSSLLVMMIVGGALFPPAMGLAADIVGVRSAFLVPILSYVFIAYYGWWSHRRINLTEAPGT